MKIFNKRALVSLGAIFMSSAVLADPPVQNVPSVFCMRITDMERSTIADGSPGNDFVVQFEMLNWSNKAASKLFMSGNIGTTTVLGAAPTIVGAGIDRDGRGGALGGNDIDASGFGLTQGAGISDPIAIHSGRGRGDLPGKLNDWNATAFNAASANWGMGGAGTQVPNRDLIGALTEADAIALVPGLGLDALGDSAIDGGPPPYTAPLGGGQPNPDGSGNVLDGFTLTIADWDVGEAISLNWFLADLDGNSIGTSQRGNAFGFGVLNLVRLGVNDPLPGGLLVGNTGFNQNLALFAKGVFDIPDGKVPGALFAGEIGASITAAFLNPEDNIFEAIPNTEPIPAPSAIMLLMSAMFYRVSRRERFV
ncbi:MAG: hypothetical protein GQ582_13565 [Methyloprofundus sp.]|nr:hypothetical protein [Methyloprofundus sp.]